MRFPGKLKISIGNLSPRAIREIIVIIIILCLSFILSLPAFIKDLKAYRESKDASAAVTDGLQTSLPEKQGMDSALLEEAGKIIGNTQACSLIVARHGYIVYEKYNDGYDQQDYNNVFSVTKSFISALTGIAIEKGAIGSVDDKVERYLPEYFKTPLPHGWKEISIRHLLTMTPGFCEDLASWTNSGDWVKATFELPLKFKPGEKFQYANSASHLLSVIMTRATGMGTYDYAEKYLFGPLEIKDKKWAVDPGGFSTGYANLFLRPRDMAKFGLLYLNKGIWEGKQIVPAQWVEESTKVQYDFNKEQDKGFTNGYGYKWWISGEPGCYMYLALGYGGQSINVIPGLDLVVVITSQPDQPLSIDDMQRMTLLKEYIIPAAKE